MQCLFDRLSTVLQLGGKHDLAGSIIEDGQSRGLAPWIDLDAQELDRRMLDRRFQDDRERIVLVDGGFA